MTAYLLRAVMVIGALVAAWAAIAWAERRTTRIETRLDPGLTLFTGPDCMLCRPAETALASLGARPRVVDVTLAPRDLGKVMSLPLAVVVDGGGRVVMRRSGRTVIGDAHLLAGAAADRRH